MRLYLDSNVLIAWLRSEIDRAFNPRCLQAERFFEACKNPSIEIVVSAHFLREVKKVVFLEKDQVKQTLEGFGLKIVFVGLVDRRKTALIQRRTRIHFSDALHVAIALENHCDSIITFNLKDFKKAEMFIGCLAPDALGKVPWPIHPGSFS